jgi:hypothetical protein
MDSPPRSGESSRSLATCVLLAGCVAAVLWQPRQATAQTFGRWWWDGRLGIGQRQNDGELDEQRVRRFEEQLAELSIGLNGYLGHPAIGEFRVAVDVLLADYDGARLADADRVGFEFLLNFLQQGSYPANLYYRRGIHDNIPAEGESPFTLSGIVDATDQWGGRIRLRKGPLRGMLFGLDSSEIEFLDPLARLETRDRQFLTWSRTGTRLNNHFRIERRDQQYGTVDLQIEDYTANFDQNGNITQSLRWELSGIGVVRDTTTLGAPVGSEDYRARARLFHDVRVRDQFEVRYDFGTLDSDLTDRRESQVFSTRYRWRLGEQWEVAPFAVYSVSSLNGRDLEAPRAGVAASWRQTRGKLSTGLTARASFGEAERSEGEEMRRDSIEAYAATASIRHGRTNGFSKELEAEISHNEIRFGRDQFLDVPEVGLPLGNLDAEDFTRLLGALSWRFDSKSVKASVEWFTRDSTRSVALEEFSAESIRATLQGSLRAFHAHLESGSTTVESGGLREQEVTFSTVSAGWRPTRLLRLGGLYRFDRRDLLLTPDIDSERLELNASWRFGAFVLEAQAFERAQELRGRSENVNRGFRWTLSRRFSGWLPVVTGASRRGVIR